jgi:peptide/nickel transport system permease protein
VCVALVGFALVMINFAIDEISNPKLRSEHGFHRVVAQLGGTVGFSTPVRAEYRRAR